MARRRARAIPRRGRPTSPRARQMQSKSPRGRAMARRRPGQPTSPRPPRGPQGSPRARRNRRRAQALKRPTSPRGPQGPRSGATSRPPINPPGQGLRKFIDTMPKAIDTMPRGPQGPRGPMGGIQLAQRNAMQRQLGARRGMLGGARAPLGGASVPQRPIPNRDGRMAQMQAALAREASRANAAAARRPSIMGSLGQSNYTRQPMPPQQMQRGMGRGPMPRANIGQIQAPRPTFGQQMRSPLPRRRGRIIPRRR